MSTVLGARYDRSFFKARSINSHEDDLKIELSKYYIKLSGDTGKQYKIDLQQVLRIYILPNEENTCNKENDTEFNHKIVLFLRCMILVVLCFKNSEECCLFALNVYARFMKEKLPDLEAFNLDTNESEKNDTLIYDPYKTYSMFGVGKDDKSNWSFTDINKDYKFCDTYPSVLVVPSKINKTTLHFGSEFRSRHRIPCLTYIHRKNMASMSRSSQPLVGLYGKRSAQDEHLLKLIATSSKKDSYDNFSHNLSDASDLIVIDARSESNIISQRAFGGGSEIPSNYSNIKTSVLSIPNIHVIQSCFAAHINDIVLNKFCFPHENTHLSAWLDKIRIILKGTSEIVTSMDQHNLNTLIHCSDGWDRTPQLCALSQICLDPYFRTIEGLSTVIEKDWVSFGHQFRTRLGHICGYNMQTSIRKIKRFVNYAKNNSVRESLFRILDKDDKAIDFPYLERLYEDEVEESNVFTQFLECLYHIIIKNPEIFEYTVELIVYLHLATYSTYHSNFLFISEKEKTTYTKQWSEIYNKKLPNLWESVFKNKDRFLNKNYLHQKNQKCIIYPNVNNIFHWQNDYLKNKNPLDIFEIQPDLPPLLP